MGQSRERKLREKVHYEIINRVRKYNKKLKREVVRVERERVKYKESSERM